MCFTENFFLSPQNYKIAFAKSIFLATRSSLPSVICLTAVFWLVSTMGTHAASFLGGYKVITHLFIHFLGLTPSFFMVFGSEGNFMYIHFVEQTFELPTSVFQTLRLKQCWREFSRPVASIFAFQVPSSMLCECSI